MGSSFLLFCIRSSLALNSSWGQEHPENINGSQMRADSECCA